MAEPGHQSRDRAAAVLPADPETDVLDGESMKAKRLLKRGWVVLDQLQQAGRFWRNRYFQALKPVFDTAAFLSLTVITASLLVLCAASALAQGGVPVWTNRYDGPGNGLDYPAAIAVDRGGNVFVTGTAYTSDSIPQYTTIKYANSGVPLWTNRYDGGGANAIAVDNRGDQ
jgi:hypothetical protein